MAHDADIAQKHLIKETRSSYEMDKIYKKIDLLSGQLETIQAAMRELQKDVSAIKAHVGAK